MLTSLLLWAVAWLLPLQPFAPYTGHCWAAALPGGATDRHCFSAVFDGKHVRDAHAVSKDARTGYAGETLYSVEDGQIVFTYWNSLGGIGRGTARAVGTDLHFSLSMRGTPAAPAQLYESDWHLVADGYNVTSGGETRHFRRDD